MEMEKIVVKLLNQNQVELECSAEVLFDMEELYEKKRELVMNKGYEIVRVVVKAPTEIFGIPCEFV